ncbi:MAG TPA: hypothetical protein VFA43_18840 [Gemmatimonadaceae bacterium]|nr:hypothetical protein [Gemmatimonadaceae bacterium]
MTDPIVAALWFDLLGKIAGPAAHAVNNALNNVAINLALVQSRANTPGVAAYAERADGYLLEATRLAQAVMALSRPVPVPVEPASVLHQLVPVLRAADRVIEVHDDIAHVATTPIDGAVVRLALAATLSEGTVSRVHILRGGEEMQISGGAVPDDVADAARRAGVGLRLELGQVTFSFT